MTNTVQNQSNPHSANDTDYSILKSQHDISLLDVTDPAIANRKEPTPGSTAQKKKTKMVSPMQILEKNEGSVSPVLDKSKRSGISSTSSKSYSRQHTGQFKSQVSKSSNLAKSPHDRKAGRDHLEEDDGGMLKNLDMSILQDKNISDISSINNIP